MADWTVWATFLTLGSAAAILATYLICRVRLDQTHNRVLVLEKEIARMLDREEANERKLARILEAVSALRDSTEEHLDQLRQKLERLRAEGYATSSWRAS